jgi:hypothetical protein
MAEAKRRRRKTSSRSSSGSSSSQSTKRSTDGGSTRKRTSQSSRSARNGSGVGLPAREIVIEALRQIQDLIGRPVEAVTGIEKNGNDWTLNVEVLELERVPNTTDVIGKYEVTLDKNGELTGARRTRRYHRAEAGED